MHNGMNALYRRNVIQEIPVKFSGGIRVMVTV